MRMAPVDALLTRERMKDADVKVGQTIVNRYGLKFHIKGIVKRGAVGTYGSDIHQSLIEWTQLRKDWKLPWERKP